jgi:long-chain acyl-CoA synthetase
MNADNQGPYHISRFARESPLRPAVVAGGTGDTLTYGELDLRSRKLARHLSAQGIAKGDHIAVMMENCADYFMVCWAAQRLGLVYTPINWHLAANESAYIIENCGAKALIVSENTRTIVQSMGDTLQGVAVTLTTGTPFGRFKNIDRIIEGAPDEPDVGQYEGSIMFYSSGTTGRPKGISHKVDEIAWGQLTPLAAYMRYAYGMGRETVYLVPAPLYHAAALAWSMLVLRAGGAVVVMEKFDALEALRLIEAHQVTHAQFVPTMFVRMLRLAEQERRKHDLSSLKLVIHAAAPCAPQVKQQMIEWLGPIVHEYYAGSEGNGLTAADSATWSAHPGTVGKPVFGQVHIVGEDGRVLPPGEDGVVYFSGGADFEYYKDPEKTASAHHAAGWSTLGDIGHLDEEGYLYLSDRRTDLIISGGVNIYPKEIEDALIQHPAVQDVAVIGVPNSEFGQEVKAVVELHRGIADSSELADEMIAFCRARIAAYKCPKSVDFATLPRLPNGKMLKREVRERYLKAAVRANERSAPS